MMAVGEQTGRFGTTMQNIADVYERELDKQVQVISALVPPLVMLVIAGLIGFIVYGILAAVFGMTNALRRAAFANVAEHGRVPIPNPLARSGSSRPVNVSDPQRAASASSARV